MSVAEISDVQKVEPLTEKKLKKMKITNIWEKKKLKTYVENYEVYTQKKTIVFADKMQISVAEGEGGLLSRMRGDRGYINEFFLKKQSLDKMKHKMSLFYPLLLVHTFSDL